MVSAQTDALATRRVNIQLNKYAPLKYNLHEIVFSELLEYFPEKARSGNLIEISDINKILCRRHALNKRDIRFILQDLAVLSSKVSHSNRGIKIQGVKI